MAPRVEFHAKVTLDGNFFRRDPGKTLYANIRDLMDKLAAWGEEDVKAQVSGLSGSMPGWSGWTLDRISGRTMSYAKRRWAVTAVVTAGTGGLDKKDAIRTKAAASTIERRWHPFRRTAGRMRSARPLFQHNLTKDIE